MGFFFSEMGESCESVSMKGSCVAIAFGHSGVPGTIKGCECLGLVGNLGLEKAC